MGFGCSTVWNSPGGSIDAGLTPDVVAYGAVMSACAPWTTGIRRLLHDLD